MSFEDKNMASSGPSPQCITPDLSNKNKAISVGSNAEPLQAANQQSSLSEGDVVILWDIENCPVPSDVRPEDVAGNVRMALRVHPAIRGAVTMFSAYGDFNAFPRRLREGCQRTGVKLVDVPNGRKDAADKAILVDMFVFALDNKPPSSIMLISGDVDFAPALHTLGQRGYTIILVIPSGVGVSSALINAGRFVWHWPTVSRGEGFAPITNSLPRGPDSNGYHMSCSGGSIESHNEEDTIVYPGCQSEYGTPPNVNQMYCYNTGASREFGASSLSQAEYRDQGWLIRPRDLQGLKGQIVKLLEMYGGRLLLARVPPEYMRCFGRPLFMAEFGVCKLVHLFDKMTDAFVVVGKSNKKMLCLRSSFDRPIKEFSSSPATVKKDKKGKAVEETVDIGLCPQLGISSDDYSDDDKNENPSLDPADCSDDQLETIRQEVQELLVCYSCPVPLEIFDSLYQQRYKKHINFECFGVEDLEQLIEKLKDIVEMWEDQGGKKFLVFTT